MFEQVEINSKRWFDINPLLNEEFRDIFNYAGLYQVSNYGRIKSLYYFNKNRVFRYEPHILKNFKQKDGYCFNALYKNGIKKQFRTHRIVATAFLPNSNNLPEVNHIDCNRSNNRLDNLEWCTTSYNVKYSFIVGNKVMPQKLKEMIKNFKGEKNPNSKLKEKDVIDIRKKIKEGIPIKEIAKQYNLNPDYLYLIKNRKIWKEI